MSNHRMTYYPSPESAGGWRTPLACEAPLDPAALDEARAWNEAIASTRKNCR
jgi:hypothetical protein